MKRGSLLLLIDGLCLLAGMGVAATGLLIRYLLPPGSTGRRGGGLTLWTWDRHGWGECHFWLSVVCIALLGVHVGLHWSWVCGTIQRRLGLTPQTREGPGNRWLYGAALIFALAALLAGFLLVAGRAVKSAA